MSETSKVKGSNKATITYMVYGAEKDKLTVKASNEQPTNIPGIPMEISVDTHSFDIEPDGTIVRKNRNGEKLPGKVTDKKVIQAVQASRGESER